VKQIKSAMRKKNWSRGKKIKRDPKGAGKRVLTKVNRKRYMCRRTKRKAPHPVDQHHQESIKNGQELKGREVRVNTAKRQERDITERRKGEDRLEEMK